MKPLQSATINAHTEMEELTTPVYINNDFDKSLNLSLTTSF